METYNRETILTELSKYCHMAKEHDIIEVTKWFNGEGIDVTVGNKMFSLTYGELEAINVLTHYKG